MGFETLVRDLYGKYAPDVDVEEKLQAISGSDYNPSSFMDDFYAKYNPTGLNPEKKEKIFNTYFADEIKASEDKELKKRGQVRAEDLSTGTYSVLKASDGVFGALATVASIAQDVMVDVPLAINHGMARFAAQIDNYMKGDKGFFDGGWRRLTGDEVRKAHMVADIVNQATPGLSGLGTTQTKKSTEHFIEKLGMNRVVEDGTLSEAGLAEWNDTDESLVEKVDDWYRIGVRGVSSGVESLPYTIAAMSGVGQIALGVGGVIFKRHWSRWYRAC
jgi:hypothetical protein